MAQYYQLVPNVSSGDDIKRIFTNLDSVQLVHIDDQSNSQFIIPQDESSYVLNDNGNQVQQLVYQQSPQQPQKQAMQPQQQQQTYDPPYLVQDTHESVVTNQHHQMQQTQHPQQVSLAQDNTQQIYYQTDSNQLVQTNQIMQHVQQPQQVIYQTVQSQSNPQSTQQQPILLHKSPDGRIRHIQTPQVMMTGSPINHPGQIEQQQQQQQQHVILQNQGNGQVLVQSSIPQQPQQNQSQHSSQMVAVRPQQRIYYKNAQGQLIGYQPSDDSAQTSHMQSHVQHSPQRYVQQSTQPQRILSQQATQQHQQQQQQTHIMSPPAAQTNQQGIVFHQVQNQPKASNQIVPQLGSVQQSPQRLLTAGTMSSNMRLSQPNRLMLNNNNNMRLNNPTGIRNQNPRSYLRNSNPTNATTTAPVLTPNIISQPRVTRPRASTPSARGRGGRGAKNLAAAQVRMISNAATGTIQQRQTPIRNITPNVANNQFLQNQPVVKTYLTDSTGQIQLQQTGGQQRILSYSDGSQQKLVAQSTSSNPIQQPTQIKERPANPTNKSSSQMQVSSQSDDIEDSIQKIFVSKADVKTDTEEAAETDDANIQFDSSVNSYSQVEDDKKPVPGTNTMNLEEYKQRIKIAGRGFAPPNRANQQNIPINRVQPMPQQQNQQPQSKPQADPGHVIQTQEIIQNRIQNQSQQDHPVDGIEKGNARMLVILASGEQRLITFTLPRDSCTVQELLEQVNVPFDSSTVIQCVSSKGANIDYVVTVGIPLPPPESRAEWIQNAEASLMLNKTDTNTTQQQQTQQSSPQALQPPQKHLNDADKLEDIIPSKYIAGFYAVCKLCGTCSLDHAKCDRCKRVFVEEPKRYPFGSKTEKATQNTHTQMSIEKRPTLTSELMGRATKTLATLTSGRGRGSSITISQRGRGRGGMRSAARQTEAAPVILTLSSDDEEQDEEKTINQKSEGTEALVTNLVPLQCEPLISEMENEYYDTVRENVADLSNSTDKICTNLFCKLIRIGTHKFQPKEKVTITSKGIRIIAPSCGNPDENICLDIMHPEIVKIVAHLSKTFSVLYLYTLPRCGAYIRESLDMKPKNELLETPYYNSTDRAEPYKRIVIQIENFLEENRSVMKSIFPATVLEFIGIDDAKELLNRSSSKDKTVRVEPSGSLIKLDNDQNIRQILIYPPGKGGISINTEDYMCLAIDQYLNDVIIDFFMKYIHLHLPKEQQEKTHIFSTFFYKRLTTMTSRQRHSKDDAKLTAAQKRHARVASWTKNVNLFEKDFIIIPINEQSHWFLAIICFPKLKGPVAYETLQPVSTEGVTKKKKAHTERKISLQIGNTTITPLSKREYEAVTVGDEDSERDEAEGDDSDLASDDSDFENGSNGNSNSIQITQSQSQAIKQPMILIFDSLAGASRNRVVATLRDYLTCEYKAKCKDPPSTYNKLNMPGCSVKVPQQNNFTDCGLFVLQYTESFFKDPIKDYKIPIKQLVNWFENITVTKKREDIANLLKELVGKQHPERLPLPDIQLPTQEGKLIEYTEGEAEFEEDDMEEELEEEEEDEVPTASSPSEINNSKINTNVASKQQIVFKRSISDVSAGKSQESVMRKQIRLEDNLNNLNSNSINVNIGNKSNMILNTNNTNTSVSQ